MSNARKLADNLPTEGQLGDRNLIINGAQNIHQRGDKTGLTSNTYTTDRFFFAVSGRDELVCSIVQSTDVPSGYGFANSLKYTTTTPESSIAVDEYVNIWQKVEAQNLQHLAYGTSSAKKVTLSFWVKSSVTGTFCIGLYKADNTAQIHNKTYTINSASTWEQKTITFEANTLSGGAIDNNNGTGFYVTWQLAAGSNFDSGSSTSSGWANYTTTNWCAPNTTDAVITTTNATFQLTGIQLEVGPQSTPFEHEPVGVTLSKCERYFYKLPISSFGPFFCNYVPSHRFAHVWFPVRMRTTPTSTTTNAGGTIYEYHPDPYHTKYYATAAYDLAASVYLQSFQADAEL